MALNYFLTSVLLFCKVDAFNRGQCLQDTMNLLGNNSLSPESPFFFRDHPDSPPYNAAGNMTLTLRGCDILCGPEQTFYPDIGPRFTVWLIPVLLLLANVEIGPTGKRDYLALLHVLGDPIDSLWSLLHKIDAWDRCYAFAVRVHRDSCRSCQLVVAAVFAGHEEVQGPRIDSEHDLRRLFESGDGTGQFLHWRRAAICMAEDRHVELGRTNFALIVYAFGLICAFVPKVGGDQSSPPGGRIATGVLLSWLVPLILLTNAVGGLSSERAAYRIMSDLAANTGKVDAFRIATSESICGIPLLERTSFTEYREALPWSGGNYLFRPWKSRYITSTRRPRVHTLMILVLSIAPVLLGLLGGFLILWYQPPTGFNYRHIWLIGVVLLWIISAVVTHRTHTVKVATGQYHWRLVLIKDSFVAISSVSIMCLSAAGLFNSCYYWSGPLQYRGAGRVPMPVTVYIENAKSVCPGIVTATLVMQIILVLAVRVRWRHGFWLLRWSKETRSVEWSRAFDGIGCVCAHHMDAKVKACV